MGNLQDAKSMGNFIGLFNYWSVRILIFLVILEMIFFFSPETLFGVFTSMYGWLLIVKLVIKHKVVSKYPLSSLIVIGFGLCNFYFPLAATLMEWHPVTFNLDVPNLVFLHGVLAITVVVFSFLLYIKLCELTGNRPSAIRRILTNIGFYSPPDDLQIWILGGIGLMSLLFVFGSGANSSDAVGSDSKFISGFFPFAYSPYFLFLKNIYSDKPVKSQKKMIWVFVIYTILLLVVAFMTNHRSTFMKVVMGLGFTYFVGLLMSKFSYKIFTPKNLVVYLITFFLLTGPLMDLGLAMVIVRGQKHDLSSSELVEETVAVFLNRDELESAKKLMDGTVITNRLWDEHYVDNIFLARLCNLKANDLSLYHAEKINDITKTQDFFFQKMTALLPSPVLEFMDIHIDKDMINLASYGDYIYYISTGDYYGLESKRQAHLEGAGMAAFGYWYLLILVIVIIPLFGLMDLLTFPIKREYYITIPALTIMPMIMTIFNFEGLSTFISFIVRGWIQMVILYVVLYKITGLIKKIKLI